MKKLILLVLLFTGLIFAQSKEEIYNNLQRGGDISITTASPDSSYHVVIWNDAQGEVRLVTVQNLGGAGAFDTLSANYAIISDSLEVSTGADIVGTISLENNEQLQNITDGDIAIVFDDSAGVLGQVFIQSSLDTPNVVDNMTMEIVFNANDDSSGATDYVTIIATATDVSDESEDSKIDFKTFAAGTEQTPLSLIGAGTTLGGALTFKNGESIDNATNGAITINEVLKLPLHTVAAGDSALGFIFLSAADTNLYIGTGTDIISIVDAAP